MNICHFSAKGIPKSTELVPWSVPKANLGEEKPPDHTQTAPRDDFENHFGTTWSILDAILGTAGRQGAPKIKLFGTKSHQNLKK